MKFLTRISKSIPFARSMMQATSWVARDSDLYRKAKQNMNLMKISFLRWFSLRLSRIDIDLLRMNSVRISACSLIVEAIPKCCHLGYRRRETSKRPGCKFFAIISVIEQWRIVMYISACCLDSFNSDWKNKHDHNAGNGQKFGPNLNHLCSCISSSVCSRIEAFVVDAKEVCRLSASQLVWYDRLFGVCWSLHSIQIVHDFASKILVASQDEHKFTEDNFGFQLRPLRPNTIFTEYETLSVNSLLWTTERFKMF